MNHKLSYVALDVRILVKPFSVPTNVTETNGITLAHFLLEKLVIQHTYTTLNHNETHTNPKKKESEFRKEQNLALKMCRK